MKLLHQIGQFYVPTTYLHSPSKCLLRPASARYRWPIYDYTSRCRSRQTARWMWLSGRTLAWLPFCGRWQAGGKRMDDKRTAIGLQVNGDRMTSGRMTKRKQVDPLVIRFETSLSAFEIRTTPVDLNWNQLESHGVGKAGNLPASRRENRICSMSSCFSFSPLTHGGCSECAPK